MLKRSCHVAKFLTLSCITLLAGTFAECAEYVPPFPGKKSQWEGFDRYDFTINDKPVSITVPTQPRPGKLWVWKAIFNGAMPGVEIAMAKAGLYTIQADGDYLLGAPKSVEQFNSFYKELTEKHGFARKPAVVGLSRGGLYAFNWAAANPDKVACVYGDNAVCDFKSWPGGKGKGKASPGDWGRIISAYGFKNDAEALTYDKNPVDNLKPLADAKVPLLHVYGELDDVVPWAENAGIMAERYRKLGGSITMIPKSGMGHHPHGLSNPAPIIEFLVTNLLKANASAGITGELRLPRNFSDNMMLQRDREIPVWGWAKPGEEISVKFVKSESKTRADENGNWRTTLPPIKSGEGLVMTISASNTIVLRNIIIGDVWIAAGQSNMVHHMNWGVIGSDKDRDAANFPKIRHMRSGRPPNPPKFLADSPLPDLQPNSTGWQILNNNTAGDASAVAFYFAREVHEKSGVPIGWIDVSAGGTPIESWLARNILEGDADAVSILQGITKHRDHESLYYAMVAPLLPMPVKGVIWYQGETNENDSEIIYFQKMKALLDGWRKAWGRKDLPLYFVQLCTWLEPVADPAGGGKGVRVRDGQTMAMQIPNTGMVVTIDIGDANGNIHASNKADVGWRLARWALVKTYGLKDIAVSGPIYREMKIEAGKIRILFNSTDNGLMIGKKNGREPVAEDLAGELRNFAIAGTDKQWHWADAKIDGSTVIVSSASVPNPVAVRYAWALNPGQPNLYNRDGLPASPFRTDDW